MHLRFPARKIHTIVLVIKLAETTGKRRNDTAKKKDPV
jgi:hypothetical protein